VAEVKDVVVPDIGDFTDVPVIEILVGEGDAIEPEAPLVELESDKATMEVPAPFGGTVKELKVSVGDKVSQGTVLLTVEASENGSEPAAAEEDEPATEADSAQPVEAAIEDEAQAEDREPPPAKEPEAEPEPEPRAASTDGDGPVYASPAVRRLAREKGVDLSTVQGSGRKGRITKEDLERPAEERAPERGAAAPAAGEGERVELTRIPKLSGQAMSRAWETIPHVTHHEDADITDLEAFRKQLNAEQDDVKVTMVALLLKASAAALDEFPRFASSLDGEELVVKRERHLGFAADTPNGLVVPVIHDVDRKGLLQIAGELTELSGKARAGKLGPKEMSGAVFTISSLGGIGGTGFTPIVNPPQVAILGAVRSAMKPVWDGEAFVPRLMLPLSLSYDHRVIDGAAAARFCAHLAKLLGDLRRVLL
jgi:pyruvate dehydrogenase E2 component (dihydrolipoamide acetyltransferase)